MMGKITITPVVENSSPNSTSLFGEHGLSIHIKNGDEYILFDTGQGGVFDHNMTVLGKDIAAISKVVLSHGHYDHTGGLGIVAETGSFDLFLHPEAFQPKYISYDNETLRDIGCPFSQAYLEKRQVTCRVSAKSQAVSDNIMTTGEIPLNNHFECIEPWFFSVRHGQKVKDMMPDDSGIVISTEKGTVLVLGCTHRGIINTLDHVSNMTGSRQFHTVMGGLHLGGADEAKMNQIIDSLQAFDIAHLVTGHCTGSFAQHQFEAAPSINHEPIILGKPYTF